MALVTQLETILFTLLFQFLIVGERLSFLEERGSKNWSDVTRSFSTLTACEILAALEVLRLLQKLYNLDSVKSFAYSNHELPPP